MKAALFPALLVFLSGCTAFCPKCPECPSSPVAQRVLSAPKLSSADSLIAALTFIDTVSRIRLRLPAVTGWETQRSDTPGVSKVAFMAMHLGKLVNLALSLEPLNSEPRDYFILVSEANRFETRPGFAKLSQDTLRLHGKPAVRFVYRSNVELPPSEGEGDTLPRIRSYVFTNVFFQNRDHDAWLEINTLGEAYDRKVAFIDSIVNGLDTLP
jgi:hypothetical protein